MTVELQRRGTAQSGRIILAHGAGAGMDSDFMQYMAMHLASHGFESILFNFPYMEKRQKDGKKRPPDRAPKLLEHFKNVLSQIGNDKPLLIGGKSMGGRIASMLAAEYPTIANGLILMGYPFHPPGKPENLRTNHLSGIKMPVLLIQGERDTFGGTNLVSTLNLPSNFEVFWSKDGDHSLKPRKKSGRTETENRDAAITAISSKEWF